jgi:hypothetical protein
LHLELIYLMTGEQTTLLLVYSTCTILLVFREIRKEVVSDRFLTLLEHCFVLRTVCM